jgi:hypothetical protein
MPEGDLANRSFLSPRLLVYNLVDDRSKDESRHLTGDLRSCTLWIRSEERGTPGIQITFRSTHREL